MRVEEVTATREDLHRELHFLLKEVTNNGYQSIARAISEKERTRLLKFMSQLTQLELSIRRKLAQYESSLGLDKLDILDNAIDISLLENNEE